MSSNDQLPTGANTPSLDVLPDLIADASPMFDPSLNPTPQDLSQRDYFPSQSGPRKVHELAVRTNTAIVKTESESEEIQEAANSKSTVNIGDLLTRELNPSNAIFNNGPFVPATAGPCFANPAQVFWYQKTSSMFSNLLDSASYSEPLKTRYIDWFNHSIIPALGPVPSPDATWTPHLTHTQSPFEPSWNLHGEDRVTPTQQIRFTFEPIGASAGTPEDPFNQTISSYFVSALERSNVCPNLDLIWWNHFSSTFFVTPAETAKVLSLLPANKAPPTCFLGFDLPTDSFAPILKPYLFPHRRALLSGKSNTEVILSAVKELHSPATPLLAQLTQIENFINTSKADLLSTASTSNTPSNLQIDTTELSLEMLSIDCLPTTTHQPRIKLYLKTHNTSLDSIAQIYTLGQSSSPTPTQSHALALFHTVWESLTGLEGEWNSTSEPTTSFLFFGLEIVPGREEVDVKIYVPVWTCGIDEGGVREGVGNWFASRGWGVGGVYEGLGREGKGGEGGGGGMTHTYLAFSFSEERGCYVTLYYSPGMGMVG